MSRTEVLCWAWVGYRSPLWPEPWTATSSSCSVGSKEDLILHQKPEKGKVTNIEDWVQKPLDTFCLPFPSLHLVRGREAEFRICAAQRGTVTKVRKHPKAINNSKLGTLTPAPPPATTAGSSSFELKEPREESHPKPPCTAPNAGTWLPLLHRMEPQSFAL